MKTPPRILVPFTHGHSGAALLSRAGEIAAAQQAELLVVSVVDTRSGFAPDGPAANLPDEHAARLAPAERKRLENELMRHGLDQAQARVIWGEPRAAVSALIERWQPDTIVCDGRTRRLLPARMEADGPTLMTVGPGPLARLTGLFFPSAQGHA